MERTVGEVLPTVKANQESIKQVLLQLAASKTDKEKAAAEWKVIWLFGDFSTFRLLLLLPSSSSSGSGISRSVFSTSLNVRGLVYDIFIRANMECRL